MDDLQDQRMDALVEGIVRLSSGDLSARLDISPARDSIDAVISGVNLLAEELEVIYEELEQRVQDRTASLHAAQIELERMAMYDSLTGLPNRTLLRRRIDDETLAAARGEQSPALILLDLDAFKAVNDSLGHSAGDDVLIEVGRRLNSTVRESDVVARLGGDEFAVLLPQTSDKVASEIADRALAALRPDMIISGTSIRTLASIGVRCGEVGQSGEDMMRDADTAMYVAKNLGRGNVQVFHPAMLQATHDRFTTLEEFRRAVATGELRVHYQPVISLGTSTIVGAEALVRWQHPDRGLLYPEAFIGIAEESGLVLEIGEWMINAVASQLNSWQDILTGRDFAVRVNLSAAESRTPGLVGFIDRALAKHSVPAERLIVEITETSVMTDQVASTESLRGLRELGVGVEIDDFGTGYSSISYLRKLPAQAVKMDSSLIEDIAEDPRQLKFVAAILQLIEAAGLLSVAEGIETADQARLLTGMGCNYGQGYFFSRPMEADMMAELVRSWPLTWGIASPRHVSPTVATNHRA
ncbi:EAL domain-containing protein [Arthrobacter sp. H20]|uniref:putative bifunctional diguanylate cyclase/phosphodiesterase n=1 Tax=Arthrobacter sp. H20 TaxID=1267981 RepID=UPI0004B18CB5|nr:EAL domain-containing protein [Arthrobacter sp. H20]